MGHLPIATPTGTKHAKPSWRLSKYMATPISIGFDQISCMDCIPSTILSISALIRVTDDDGSMFRSDMFPAFLYNRDITPPRTMVMARYDRCCVLILASDQKMTGSHVLGTVPLKSRSQRIQENMRRSCRTRYFSTAA